jgi:hypothetical protein
MSRSWFPAAIPLSSRLEEGQYRLALTYRRDNTAADPGALVLSQAGDTSEEILQPDVPWLGVEE